MIVCCLVVLVGKLLTSFFQHLLCTFKNQRYNYIIISSQLKKKSRIKNSVLGNILRIEFFGHLTSY